MPVEIVDHGQGNTHRIDPWFDDNARLRVEFTGDGNSLQVDRPQGCHFLNLTIGGGSHVRIESLCTLGNLYVHAENQGRVWIGPGCSFNGAVSILLHEPSLVSIGNGCLIAGGVEIATSDMHTVYDITSGRRINPPADIVLAERVWVGANAALLKGARIGAGSLVGTRAVVTGEIPANCSAAGVPARVVRRGVSWIRELVPWT